MYSDHSFGLKTFAQRNHFSFWLKWVLISHTVIKTAIRDWAYEQNDKRWRGLTTCRQAKEMISGRCRRRERDLLALPRQTLRLVIGVLTGHTQVGQHLSIMGLKQDPLCSYCSAAEESASHFLCQCDYFATLRMSIWGKPDLYPTDIDTATVGDIARFVKKIS